MSRWHPKYRMQSFHLIDFPPTEMRSLVLGFCRFFRRVKKIASVLELLMRIFYLVKYFSSRRLPCLFSTVSYNFEVINNAVSSANKANWQSSIAGMSLVYRLYSAGDKTESTLHFPLSHRIRDRTKMNVLFLLSKTENLIEKVADEDHLLFRF